MESTTAPTLLENEATRLDGQSLDVAAEKLAQLKQLMPEVFAEGKLDVDKLRLVLGEDVYVGEERYGLNWPGKAEAYKEIQKRTTATLVPDREGSVDFDTAENVFIEGENLEVLRVLQKSYFGKVKMIYIDPPYNTGNDSFVYPDDYTERREEFEKRAGLVDQEGYINKQDLWRSNSKENGQYHSVWLSMMLPRLFLSRNLLCEDGVIFVSIDDNEVFNLKLLMDEIFGQENFYCCFVWQRRSGAMDSVDNVSTDHEYVLCYGKSKTKLKGLERTFDRYTNPDDDSRGPWIADNLSAGKAGGDTLYPIKDPLTGIEYMPPKGRYWPYNRRTMQQKIDEGRVIFPKKGKDGSPLLKRFQNEAKFSTVPVSTWMRNESAKGVGNSLRAGFNTEGTKQLQELFGDKVFSHPKPTVLIKSFASQCLGTDDIVMDFFAGSASTAQAIIELNQESGGNRKFICIQMPESIETDAPAYSKGYRKISEISRDRIRKVLNKHTQNNQINFAAPGIKGFKSFILESSNFKIWREDASAKSMSDQLNLFQNQFSNTEIDKESVVYELMLKHGLLLSAAIEYRDGVYYVDNNRICIILEKISSEKLAKVAEKQPKRVVIQESIFGISDHALTNVALELEEANISFELI
ncbi:site-specific DNA-methyltransferase [Hymenobacter aerophilus]|uniref:site-specific DNA-methyltransferase n=1 Tax=Hymenobacter aerophilus TaxID=119644 RepID=UPI00036C65AB|nr:site-specific DNA-methyltransferase [Hymenobacter aerophilus]